MASADSTDARLITQPTDKSMPAEMMTKVWPSPSRTTGVIATKMFWELRTVTKVAELNTGTEMTKKRIIRPRKHHAHSSLMAISRRLPGDRVALGDAGALVAWESGIATRLVPPLPLKNANREARSL